MFMRNHLHQLLACGLLVLSAFLHASTNQGQLAIGTLNCRLLFNPAINHRGSVDDQNRVTPEIYRQKLKNLAGLLAETDIIALQETGGPVEIRELAALLNMQTHWVQGRDTFTGQETGFLTRKIPGWEFKTTGRDPKLENLSKHLTLKATRRTTGEQILLLNVHLIRPIGKNAGKHQGQLLAIHNWITNQNQKNPEATILVLGDFNSKNPANLFDPKIRDAGRNTGPTHIDGSRYDRIFVAGPKDPQTTRIQRPPFGKKPNKLQITLWSDHFLLTTTFNFNSIPQ
jgi:endonuclease/exonuclease/phosphatase family metal-dependent hydrolase